MNKTYYHQREIVKAKTRKLRASIQSFVLQKRSNCDELIYDYHQQFNFMNSNLKFLIDIIHLIGSSHRSKSKFISKNRLLKNRIHDININQPLADYYKTNEDIRKRKFIVPIPNYQDSPSPLKQQDSFYNSDQDENMQIRTVSPKRHNDKRKKAQSYIRNQSIPANFKISKPISPKTTLNKSYSPKISKPKSPKTNLNKSYFPATSHDIVDKENDEEIDELSEFESESESMKEFLALEAAMEAEEAYEESLKGNCTYREVANEVDDNNNKTIIQYEPENIDLEDESEPEILEDECEPEVLNQSYQQGDSLNLSDQNGDSLDSDSPFIKLYKQRLSQLRDGVIPGFRKHPNHRSKKNDSVISVLLKIDDIEN